MALSKDAQSMQGVQETSVQKYIWSREPTFVPPTVDKYGCVLVPIRLAIMPDDFGYLSYEQVLRWLSIRKIDISTMSHIWMDGNDVIHFDLPEEEAEKLLAMGILTMYGARYYAEKERPFDRVPYINMDQRREWSKNFAIPGLVEKCMLPDTKNWVRPAFQNNAASQQPDDDPIYPSVTKRPRL